MSSPSKADDLSLDLFIVRPGVYPERYLGHLLTVPDLPEPGSILAKGTGPLADADLEGLFEKSLVGVGRPARLVPFGLVEPTAWERRFVAWVSRRLGLEPEAGWEVLAVRDRNPGFGRLAAALADPLAPPPESSGDLSLLACDDPELEAIAAARRIRAWLAPQPFEHWPEALDGVLVLLPASPERRSTWKRVLERHGIAADVPAYLPVAGLPLGRWLLSLCRLARFGESAVHRDDLRGALLAPFVRMPPGARRSDLRECLRSLRVHRVSLALWKDHLAQWEERKRQEIRERGMGEEEKVAAAEDLGRRREGLDRLAEAVAGRLADPRVLFEGLRGLVDDLGAAERVRASGVDQAAAALERTRRALFRLGEEEKARPSWPPGEKLGELERRLASALVRTAPPLRHGVRVASYAEYDGRAARLLVLAGLEEGGHPRTAARPSRDEAALAARLGLGTPEEELARQARVAAAAAGKAREAVHLSWSRVDEAGGDTFAGPLLAAVRGREGHDGMSEERFGDAQANPPDDSAVESPADVLASTGAGIGAALPAGPLRSAWERARAAAAHARLLDEGRAPGEKRPVGPYAGKVGVSLAAKRYSPTALEQLGQCPSRYFLERVLGIEEAGDEGVDLDPMETGSMLHEALALAAQKAIRDHGAWSLRSSGAEREQRLERLGKELVRELDGASRRYLASHPTLPAALVERVVARWQRVLARWLEKEADQPEGGLFPTGTTAELSSLSDAQLEALSAADPEVGKALHALRELELGAALALLDGARGAPAPSAAEAGRRWSGSETRGLVTQKDFREAAVLPSKPARGRALDELAARARARYGEKESELQEVVAEAWRRDRLSVPPRAVASEWSFGDVVREGADPRSTEEPLHIDLPGGGRLSVRGRVDRVDAAKDRPDAAVVDYKSGRPKTRAQLVRELGEGRHLQLPLYALAVERLLASELREPLHVVRGRLDYLRNQAQPEITFEPGLQPELRPEGQPDARPTEVEEVVLEHLGHSVRLLEAGTVPLLPRACPNDSPLARCPCNVVCDYRPEARERFAPSDTQPLFVPPERRRGGGRRDREGDPRVRYRPARPVEDPPASARARAEHEAGHARACDTTRDVVVSAGAGSGKTRALVDRYAKALGPGCGPENVLCITFTRKATAEMRSRIREKILEGDGAADEVARRAWITALGTAPIQTIDAFAARVVAELSGEELDLSVGSGSYAAEYVAERMAREASRPSEELDLLLDELPVPQVRAVLASLVEAPALSRARGTAIEIAQGWNEEAKRLAGDLPERLSRFVETAGASGARGKALLPLAQLGEAVAAFAAHGAIAGLWAVAGVHLPKGRAPEELAPFQEELRGLRDEVKAGWFKEPMKALSACDGPGAVAARVLREAKIAHAAIQTARSWAEGYRQARAERRVTSFADVLARAAKVLAEKEPAEVQARFPYLHILVDEFQDTDEAQLRFIELLREKLEKAGKRPALFAVGDPKQSIYRFRGAEVDQFEEYWEKVEASSRAVLAVCWRAEPALSVAVSRLFGRLFDGRLDPEAQVPWEPLAPRERPGPEPCVELLWPDDLGPAAQGETPEEAGDADGGAEAAVPRDEGADRALVRRLREILAEGDGAGEESPVAVLTHSWARAVHYGKLLREHGVPAFVQGGRGLLDAPEVRHLFHWLEALEREDDDLVFAALLRGASVGLSDPGLYAIRNGHGLELRDLETGDGYLPAQRRNALSTLRRGFRFDGTEAARALEKEAGRPLDAEVREALGRDEGRLRAFGEAWGTAARLFGLVPLAAVVEAIVQATGYEAVLRNRADGLQALANLRSFEDLVRAAEAGRSPGDAVREIERIAAEGEDPAAGGLSLQPGAAVTVTVVHQAKGREWETVVVPDLERVQVRGRVARCDLQRLVQREGKRWDRRYLPASLVENPRDLLATTGGVGARVLAAAASGAERAESRRLFYVACTRAKKRLVLTARWPDGDFFAEREKKGAVGLADAGSWLEDLVYGLEMQLRPDGRPAPEGVWKEGRDFRWVQPAGEGFGESVGLSPAPGRVEAARVRLAAQGVPAEPLVVVNPSSAEARGPVPPPSISRPAREPPARGESPFGTAADEGSAFHRAVQLWSYRGECSASLVAQAVRDVAGDWRLGERAARVKEILDAQAACQPALLAELKDAAARGELFHEVAVGYPRADGAWVEGVIDLLYRDGEGAWHLVDYKTDRGGEANAVDVKVREYYPQVRAYADAVSGELPGGAGVKTFRLWLLGMGVVARWEA